MNLLATSKISDDRRFVMGLLMRAFEKGSARQGHSESNAISQRGESDANME